MLDLAECPCTGGNLDRLIQPAILVILAEGPLHGYGIAERLAEMPSFSDAKPDVSGIYRFLKRMEQKELVIGTWDLSYGGPARKQFQITAGGLQCLQEWARTLEDYQKRVSHLLRATQKTIRR